MWSDQEKRIQKIDRLARSFLIQGLSNDIYSFISSNKTAKDLWDALARHMLGSEYGEQGRKAAVLYESVVIQKIINKNLMDINIDALYNILKQNQRDVNDAMGSKKKTVVVTSDPLALIAQETKVSKSKEKVVVSSDSEGNDKQVVKKDDEKKRDMSRVKCYNCKKEGHFAKDYKKVKVKDYEYYKTKMLLAKKDKDEQVLLAEDQAWMESSSDSNQEINANIIFMAQIEKILSDSEASSSSADEKIYEYRENKIEFAYDYGNLNASYVNEKINFEDDYFQEIINPDFDKIDSPFQKTSSLKPYVPNVIIEKIIINLEDEVRYSRKDLLACNNSHLGEISSAYMCNDAMNVSCDSRMNDLLDDNNFFIFDDESVRISPVSKMPFRKKPRDSMNVRSKSNLNKSLPRIVRKWLP
nr:hypothetical protein [Tanacetum cinerariifolium]